MIQFRFLLFMLVGFIFIISCDAESSSKAEQKDIPNAVKYKVVLSFKWTSAAYPISYPDNAHFSPTVGWTHKKSAADFMKSGVLAHSGMKEMAETGGTDKLKQKISKEIASGNGIITYTGKATETGVATMEVEVQVNEDFHYVSFVSMLAPSPDWYVGAIAVNLKDDKGNFVSSKEVKAPVYDSGTDSGDSFKSENEATDPPVKISRFTSPAATDADAGAQEAAREAAALGFTTEKVLNTNPLLTVTFTKK